MAILNFTFLLIVCGALFLFSVIAALVLMLRSAIQRHAIKRQKEIAQLFLNLFESYIRTGDSDPFTSKARTYKKATMLKVAFVLFDFLPANEKNKLAKLIARIVDSKTLIRHLLKGNVYERSYSVHLLSFFKSPEVLDILQKLMVQDPSETVRVASAIACMHVDSNYSAVDALMSFSGQALTNDGLRLFFCYLPEKQIDNLASLVKAGHPNASLIRENVNTFGRTYLLPLFSLLAEHKEATEREAALAVVKSLESGADALYILKIFRFIYDIPETVVEPITEQQDKQQPTKEVLEFTERNVDMMVHEYFESMLTTTMIG